MQTTKYVFVTGGVVSGLGKGITVASLGRLLKARGYKVVTQKCDAYINIDPGNLNPSEHGEIYITDDGAETDLDLGHYERFTDVSLTENSFITMGKIYSAVLDKERKGLYKGATVQVVPHITNEIMERIRGEAAALKNDGGAGIVITEIGGTVGDIESLPILEAIRQIAHDVGRENVVFVHTTLVPHLDYIGEMKTKPTQHSVKELLSRGIQPDIVVCRSDREIPADAKAKLALFCNIETRCIIPNLHAQSLYEVPLLLEAEGFADAVCRKLDLEPRWPDLADWRALVNKCKNPSRKVTIGLAGKYASSQDAYLSVSEALSHAGIHQEVQVEIKFIPCETDWLEAQDCPLTQKLDGIILAGSINDGASTGMEKIAEYSARNNIPFLGIGSGLLAAMCLLPCGPDKLAEYTDQAILVNDLGAKSCRLIPESITGKAYGVESGSELITERFRNRVKLPYINEENWLISEEGVTAEYTGHPFLVCVQFHPEYRSTITNPNPLFVEFIKACLNKL